MYTSRALQRKGNYASIGAELGIDPTKTETPEEREERLQKRRVRDRARRVSSWSVVANSHLQNTLMSCTHMQASLTLSRSTLHNVLAIYRATQRACAEASRRAIKVAGQSGKYSVYTVVIMAPSTAILCIVLLGAVCVTNAMPVEIQRDIKILDRAVNAAKFLYDTLKAEQDTEATAPPATRVSFEESAQMQRDIAILDRAVRAAKFLYDTLKAEQDAEARVPTIEEFLSMSRGNRFGDDMGPTY